MYDHCHKQPRQIQIQWFINLTQQWYSTSTSRCGLWTSHASRLSAEKTWNEREATSTVRVWAASDAERDSALLQRSNVMLFKTVRKPPGAESTTNDQCCLVCLPVTQCVATPRTVFTQKRLPASVCLVSTVFTLFIHTSWNGWQWSEEEYPHQARRFLSHRHRVLEHQGEIRRRNEKNGGGDEQIPIRTHEQGEQQFLQKLHEVFINFFCP